MSFHDYAAMLAFPSKEDPAERMPMFIWSGLKHTFGFGTLVMPQGLEHFCESAILRMMNPNPWDLQVMRWTILDKDELFWLLSTYVCSGPFGCIFISEGWGTHDSMILVYWYCIGSKENHKSPRYIVSHSCKLQYFPLVKSWHRFSTLNAENFYDDLWWNETLLYLRVLP